MNAYEPENPEITSVIDPAGIDCVLAAGDVADLPEIRNWLLELPETSYGQVFIEVFSEIQIETLPTPPHVGVTWLCREGRDATTRPGVGRPRGDALATAVDGWFSEWLWSDSSTGRDFHLWMGARTSSVMQSYWAKFERSLEQRWPGFCQRDCERDPA